MAEPYNQGLYPLFTTQFSTLLELKLQQMGSKLRGRIDERGYVGKMASPVNQLDASPARQPQGRYAPLVPDPETFTRRWVFPSFRDKAQLIDTFDELQTIVDPKSQYVQNAAMAFGRAIDDIVFQAAFGTSQTGQDAASLSAETFNTNATTAAPPGFQIPVNFDGANDGLSVGKMIELRRNLRHYHVDLETEPVTLVIGSQQEADLLKQVQVVSTEFNSKPIYDTDGRITRFLGFDIVVSERLPYTSTTRSCLAFAKSGLHLGIWKDMENRITRREDLTSQPWQIYTQMSIGATRTQPGKVYQIVCLDSTGGDITA